MSMDRISLCPLSPSFSAPIISPNEPTAGFDKGDGIKLGFIINPVYHRRVRVLTIPYSCRQDRERIDSSITETLLILMSLTSANSQLLRGSS